MQTDLKLPGDTNFIFEGIEEDFEDYWNTIKKDYSSDERKEAKLKVWNNLVEWIMTYSKLLNNVIPKNRVACLVETNQQYSDFTKEDILHVIEHLGKVSNHMYCAGRDYLVCNHVLNPKEYYPLQRYYISALEQITWIIATFNKTDKEDSFTDLKTRLSKLIKKR